MIKSKVQQSQIENQLLQAWYEDSLSLMGSDTGAASVEISETQLNNWQASIGILTLSSKGEEVWSHGDTQECHEFLSENDLAKLTDASITVEIFRDGLVLVSAVRNVVRIVYADHGSMMNVLRDAAPNIDLSNAELRLLLQILAGKNLRESAELDGVSYETKRSQFKSLAIRTGFRTQSEVIRLSLLALSAHALDHADARSSETETQIESDQDFLNLFYPNVFRYHSITIGTSRPLRVVETGPITGTPIVYVHSQTLPPPSQFQTDWLEKNNIRLIIPLRAGFLDENAERLSLTAHRIQATEDLASTINLFCGGNVRVVATSTGSAYAIHLARLHPNCISQLTFFSAAYLGKYDNTLLVKLVSGLHNIAGRSNLILEKIYSRYVKKMSTIDGVRALMESAYKSSPNDMKIFKDVLTTTMGHRWMYESYRTSRWSVINDVTMPNIRVWDDVSKVKIPTLFVHGQNDPVNAIQYAKNICKKFQNSKFVELENEGQSIFRHRLEEMISRDAGKW